MKVAGFAQDRLTSTVLRIRYPLEKIRSLGLCEAYVIGPMDPNQEKILKEADVVVLGRASTKETIKMVRMLKAQGKKTVFDLDDNMFDVSPWSNHYRDFGTMPVDDGQGGYLWFPGEKGFDVTENRQRRARFIELIRSVDCITVTTPPLVELYKRFNANVVMVPNSIDFTVWKRPPMRLDADEVRLLYTGAANHQEDWLYIVPVLEELQRRFDKLKIVLVGTAWKNVRNNLDYSRIEVHGWVDFEAYPHMMKTLCPDIGIAPISRTHFNDCRSSLKWVEYSALQCATVATNFGPYNRDMKDGDTGLLVKDKAGWTVALSRLIESKAYRKQLGSQAFWHCKSKYDLDYVVDDWMNTFNSVTEVKT